MTDPDEARESFPNLLQAMFVLMVLFAIEYLVAAGYIDLFGRFEAGDAVAATVITTIGNAIVFAALMSWKRLSFNDLFHPGPSSKRAVLVLLSVPIVLTFAGMAILLSDLLELLSMVLPLSADQRDMFSQMMASNPMAFLALCLMAPLFEEMLFRGVFLRGFLAHYTPREAIIYSAALFAIAHLNIFQAISAFSMGLVIGWVYVRTQSLWPCVIGHAAGNFALFLLAQLPSGWVISKGVELAPLPVQFLAISAFGLGGWMLWVLLGGRQDVVEPAEPAE